MGIIFRVLPTSTPLNVNKNPFLFLYCPKCDDVGIPKIAFPSTVIGSKVSNLYSPLNINGSLLFAPEDTNNLLEQLERKITKESVRICRCFFMPYDIDRNKHNNILINRLHKREFINKTTNVLVTALVLIVY